MKHVFRKVLSQMYDVLNAAVAFVGFLFASTIPANAMMPWDSVLGQVAGSLNGTVARDGAVIVVAFTGLMIAFGEHKGLFATIARILFGLSLALMATQWVGIL